MRAHDLGALLLLYGDTPKHSGLKAESICGGERTGTEGATPRKSARVGLLPPSVKEGKNNLKRMKK